MSIDLREIDPLYDDRIQAEDESAALVYQLIIRIARGLPAEELDNENREIGLSILDRLPTGFPEIMEFTPWQEKHMEFLRKFTSKYSRADHSCDRAEWTRFTREELPLTDSISD